MAISCNLTGARDAGWRWSLAMLAGIGTFGFASGASAGNAVPPSTTTVSPVANDTAQTTRVVILGTLGGPRAGAERGESANVLEVGDRSYLIDAGPGVSQQLARSGFQPEDMRRIFLTHLHLDHVGGLASLLGLAWNRTEGDTVDIYGPPATGTFVKSALGYLAIPIKIYEAQVPPKPSLAELVKPHDVDITKPTVIFTDDRIRVTAVENSHFSTIPVGKRPLGAARSYSCRFDTPDRSVVFSGDTGPSSGLTELARGADTLVVEVLNIEWTKRWIKEAYPDRTDAELQNTVDHMLFEHMSPDAVGQMAAAAGVKTVVLTHLAPGVDGERDLRQYSAGVRARFSGTVVVARDGAEF